MKEPLTAETSSSCTSIVC